MAEPKKRPCRNFARLNSGAVKLIAVRSGMNVVAKILVKRRAVNPD
jgi:hypothetical protein